MRFAIVVASAVTSAVTSAVVVFAAMGLAQVPDKTKEASEKATDTTLVNDVSEVAQDNLLVALRTTIEADLQSASMADVLSLLEEIVVEKNPSLKGHLEIRVIGKDLASEGITRNQRIPKLPAEGKSLAEILTLVMYHGDPTPADPLAPGLRHELVWTVASDSINDKKALVLVTTRGGVAARKQRLPRVFLTPNNRHNALDIDVFPPFDDLNPKWSDIVSATMLENEIKSRLADLNPLLVNQEKFVVEGYREARHHFNELAVLFAVISNYEKDVRWKEEAGAMARQLGRTAQNCKVGTPPVFFQSKASRDTLLLLVRGKDVQFPKAHIGPIENWGAIYDRAPMMGRMNAAFEQAKKKVADKKQFADHHDEIVRKGEVVGLVAMLIRQQGSEDSGDQEYRDYATRLSMSAKKFVAAANAKDRPAAVRAVGLIGTSCARCHDEYK